jgi:hypothetical protein
MMAEKYVFGYSDDRNLFNDNLYKDRVEYMALSTNWLPPRYAVVKMVNGIQAETVVDGLSLKTAKGYIKLLQE